MNTSDMARCPLCDTEVHRQQFAVKTHVVMQCDHCGLFFIDPYPKSGSRVEAVRSNDFGHKVADADTCYRAEAYTQLSSLEVIRRYCGDAETLLDVGCGSGYLLERLNKETNLRTKGIELNPDRARVAETQSGSPIIQVPIEQYEQQERFDIITLLDVFSHVFSLSKLFEAVTAHLADNGKFIMKTGELAPDVRITDVRSWEIPDHVQWLGLDTIDYICRVFSFRKIEHMRIPSSESVFTRQRFLAPGRSKTRDVIKKIVAYTPLALPAAKRLHGFRHGCRVYSSFVVMERA